MKSHRIFAIVLAGGASSRFGSDKLAAMLDGRPLLHHALDAVAGVADHVVVVLGVEGAAPDLPASVVGRVSLARDPAGPGGPLVGLVTGLQAMDTMTGHDPRDVALVVAGDMPTLVPAVLRRLVEALEGEPSLLAMTLAASDPAPLPMVLRWAATPVAHELIAAGGRRSLRALLEAVPSGELPESAWRALDPEGRTLRDVDTPGDIEEI